MVNAVLVPNIVEKNGKTVRMNNLELNHKICVGTLVEVNLDNNESNKTRQFIASHTRDCDGTPLYALTTKRDRCDDKVEDPNDPHLRFERDDGWSDDCLIVIEEARNVE
jgi:hypothetical protein